MASVKTTATMVLVECEPTYMEVTPQSISFDDMPLKLYDRTWTSNTHANYFVATKMLDEKPELSILPAIISAGLIVFTRRAKIEEIVPLVEGGSVYLVDQSQLKSPRIAALSVYKAMQTMGGP
eukprot:1615838-Amphidinium_carterae.1